MVRAVASLVVAACVVGPTQRPQSQDILYTRLGGGRIAGLSLVRPDGTNRTILTRNGVWDAAWAPDKARIVFTASRRPKDPGSAHVYSVRPDGTHLVQLTFGSGSEGEPRWSPDRKRIVYTHVGRAIGSSGAVWVMNADGSAKHRLAFGGVPAWSPTGDRIAYVGRTVDASGTAHHPLEVVSTEGGRPTRVAPDAWPSESLAWSPDGTRIAFFSVTSLEIANADGSAVHGIGGAWPTSLAWSPDGRRLLYGCGDFGLCTVGADLADPTIVVRGLPDASVGLADWSPDGRAIVYDDGSSLYVTDGSARLRRIVGHARDPHWR